MKHKVSELEGALLDFAVAKAEGMRARLHPSAALDRDFDCMVGDGENVWGWQVFAPSTSWVQGGPIIEREQITIWPPYAHPRGAVDQWRAQCYGSDDRIAPEFAPLEQGKTPLIAAMRAYVSSKFGDVVELQ